MKHRITFIDSLRLIPETNFDGLRFAESVGTVGENRRIKYQFGLEKELGHDAMAPSLDFFACYCQVISPHPNLGSGTLAGL
jgi:hypothetical protein